MNVKIVTMDVNKLEYLQDLLTQTGQEKQKLKSDIKKMIEFKDNMVKKLQKLEGENKSQKQYESFY